MAGRLCEHSGDWRAKLVTHPERTVAVGIDAFAISRKTAHSDLAKAFQGPPCNRR
jgi:hypothetical protein